MTIQSIRKVLFALGVLTALGYGTAQAMAPVFQTAEECRYYCEEVRHVYSWTWNPDNGVCVCNYIIWPPEGRTAR